VLVDSVQPAGSNLPAAHSRGRRMSPRAQRISLGLLVLLVYVAGSLASAAHLALVTHRVCSEHGELVHVEHAQAAQAETPRTGACASVRAGSQGRPGHEHCGLAQGLPEVFDPVRGADVPGRPACTPAADEPRAVLRAPREARYRLAPKHSPPA
jgi:hypothetical protein